jgi:mono/diheme cytochrome c family protein
MRVRSILEKRLAVAFAAFVAVMAVPAAAQTADSASPPAATILDGIFTAEQAETGRKRFVRDCSTCHAPAQFADGALLRSWAGRTVHDLLERIRTTMPYESPGSLGRQQYVDILAYFLELSALPAGPEPLKAGAGLREIRIVEQPVPADTSTRSSTPSGRP